MRIDRSTAMAVFTITKVLTVVGFVLLMKSKYGQKRRFSVASF
ncbi:putative site-specific integrase-resolvase [Chitinophaga sp. W2I13]